MSRPIQVAELAVLAVGAGMVVAGLAWWIVELIVSHGDSPRVTALKQALTKIDVDALKSTSRLPAVPLALELTLARF